MQKAVRESEILPLDVGYYTIAEAARLLRTKPKNISRWLGGYSYKRAGEAARTAQPLWRLQLPKLGPQPEMGFRDLVELRFVVAFVERGVHLNVVRRCLSNARRVLQEERPFATRKFRTDGRTIFLESFAEEEARTSGILDLRTNQLAFKDVIEQSFKDLDWEGDVVSRWRPHRGRASIVIDPKRAFGAPILTDHGIPTAALNAAAYSEGVERAARLFETTTALVREAMAFESSLTAA